MYDPDIRRKGWGVNGISTFSWIYLQNTPDSKDRPPSLSLTAETPLPLLESVATVKTCPLIWWMMACSADTSIPSTKLHLSVSLQLGSAIFQPLKSEQKWQVPFWRKAGKAPMDHDYPFFSTPAMAVKEHVGLMWFWHKMAGSHQHRSQVIWGIELLLHLDKGGPSDLCTLTPLGTSAVSDQQQM